MNFQEHREETKYDSTTIRGRNLNLCNKIVSNVLRNLNRVQDYLKHILSQFYYDYETWEVAKALASKLQVFVI